MLSCIIIEADILAQKKERIHTHMHKINGKSVKLSRSSFIIFEAGFIEQEKPTKNLAILKKTTKREPD